MEEKKINNSKTQKLSYEQLEAYAAQTTEKLMEHSSSTLPT